MANGSRRSSGELRLGRARHHSRGLRLWLGCGLAILGGCHQATLHRRADLQAELTTVTAQDLFLLGISHARSGDLLRAEQYLGAARDRGHDEVAAVYWLMRVCVAANRYQSALGHAADYLRDHPSDWSLRFVVASIYEALGDVDRAKSELERIVRAEPTRSLPHYRLAILYRHQEADQEQAKAHLEEYLRLTPEGTHAAEVRSTLTEVGEASYGPQFAPYLGTTHQEAEEVP